MSDRVQPELQRLRCAHGDIAWREAGAGLPLVLLHGIGSGSGSWAGQFDALAASFRVVAWDAPGYGASAPLPEPRPLAKHYAQALAEFLERLAIKEPVLLGHSLGAMVAAAWASQPTVALRALVLASPARGYASAPAAVRDAKYRERLEMVERLGIEGMAAQRSAGLCAPGAAPESIELVRTNMARATPRGYGQAAHMLAHDDLLAHLHKVSARPTPSTPVTVMCGEHDAVTPPAACEQVAKEIAAPFVLLRGVGHACYVEDAAQFNTALLSCLTATRGALHV